MLKEFLLLAFLSRTALEGSISCVRGLMSGHLHESAPLAQRARCGSSFGVGLLRILYDAAISLESEIVMWHREILLGLSINVTNLSFSSETSVLSLQDNFDVPTFVKFVHRMSSNSDRCRYNLTKTSIWIRFQESASPSPEPRSCVRYFYQSFEN